MRWNTDYLATEAVPTSKGERMLDDLIDQDPELKPFAQFKDTIILFTENGYQITSAYRLTKQEVITAAENNRHPFTIPDRLFIRKGKAYAVYVDGKHHLTAHNSKRDNEIDTQLRQCGIEVLRLDYTVTKSGVKQSFQQVKQFIENYI